MTEKPTGTGTDKPAEAPKIPAGKTGSRKAGNKKAGNKKAGNRGEDFTAAYLQSRGYRILERQWHCRFGEIDLIARDEAGVLCFVEVKLRGNLSVGLPREFVSLPKQKRLRQAAQLYLCGGDGDEPARFDVAEVYQEPGGLRIEYLEDAFQ